MFDELLKKVLVEMDSINFDLLRMQLVLGTAELDEFLQMAIKLSRSGGESVRAWVHRMLDDAIAGKTAAEILENYERKLARGVKIGCPECGSDIVVGTYDWERDLRILRCKECGSTYCFSSSDLYERGLHGILDDWAYAISCERKAMK